jgi:CRP/FNR family transcriptional regulator
MGDFRTSSVSETAALPKSTHLVAFRRPCHACAIQHLCLPCNLDTEEERQLRTLIRRTVSYRRGERIVRLGAPFASLYIVQGGAVKTQQLTVQGEVNLTGFHLEGDLFGLDAIGSETYPCEAVALQTTTVCQLPYGEVERICSRIPPLQHWLLSRLGGQLKAQETVSRWNSQKLAQTRLLNFFLNLQQRLEIRQRPQGGYYTMPMRKYDVALFLKITPETLSRTLKVLRAKRLLDIRSQRFRLPDVASVMRYVGE